MMVFFDEVHAVLKSDLEKLVERRFGQMGTGNTKHALM